MRLTQAVAALILSTCSFSIAADWIDQFPTQKDFPGYSIPGLDKVAIDGMTDDWIPNNNRDGYGFRIDVMGELAPHPLTDQCASPTVRVAWTNAGLAVLVRVHDATPHEAANIATMHDGDSVEFFLSDPANTKQHFQVTIAPGTDPDQGGKVRVFVHDFRADKNPAEIKIEAAASKTDDGYIVEALLPFSALNIKPAQGTKLGLQIHVNDKIAGGQIAQYRWRPTYRAWRGNEYHNPIVLSNEASPPVTFSVNAEYMNFRWLNIRLNSSVEGPQKTSFKNDKQNELGSIDAMGGGRKTITYFYPREAYGPFTFLRNKVPVATFFPDPPPSRQSGMDLVKIVFKPFAFSGTALPGADVDDPIVARDVLGSSYELKVRYFDTSLNEVKTAAKPGRYLAAVHLQSDEYEISDDRIYTLYRMPEEMKSWRDVEMKISGVEFPKEFGIPSEVSGEQSQISADLFKDLVRNDLSKTPNAATILAALSETKAGSGPMVWRTNPASLHGNFDYALRKKLNMIAPYKYLEHLPPDYADEKKKDEKFPLIIFLHGSGERGNQLNLVKTTGFPQYLESHKDFPAIVLSPQCPFGQQWRPQLVNDLVEEAIKKYRVDPDRIYMTGLSMGGYGTWAYAAWYPEKLAAILPICGIGDAKDMARLKNIPTWAFHGDVDDQVPIGPDKAGVEALKAAGGNVKFTIYPGVGHDSWTQTYNNAEIYAWMLGQKRSK